MPRIPDNLLHCVVYLYPSEAAAEDGERTGGSGFLVGVHIPFEQPPKGFLICVVTNKHVIDGGSMVVRINTHDGLHDIIALDGRHWFLHPDGDDIAVCPIGLNHLHHKFRFIAYNQFATREILEMFDVGLGDEVFIPGRFIGRDDCFPAHAAFPKWHEGRHPHCHFRGLLRLHSRYGPPDCSAA